MTERLYERVLWLARAGVAVSRRAQTFDHRSITSSR
jgi:hypothetical protein